MRSIADMLRGIPDLAKSVQFYAADQIDEVVAAALKVHSASAWRRCSLWKQRGFDPALRNRALIAAMDIVVMKSGKLKIEEMLAGRLPTI